MSCLQFQELLLTLEDIKNCYDAVIDPEYYYHHDAILTSHEIPVLLTHIEAILKLFMSSPLSNQYNYNLLRQKRLPAFATELYEVIMYRHQMLNGKWPIHQQCSEGDAQPIGTYLYSDSAGQQLQPLIEGRTRGPLNNWYAVLLRVVRDLH